MGFIKAKSLYHGVFYEKSVNKTVGYLSEKKMRQGTKARGTKRLRNQTSMYK